MNGLMVSARPFEKYRAMYRYRLQHALPCMDGPVHIANFACEQVKFAVCRAIRSIIDNVIVAEECHFGFIDNVDFFP